MARNRTPTLWLVLWAALVFQGVRPNRWVEAWTERLLAPLRYAAELGAPFAVLRSREASAADVALARGAGAEAREGARVLARLAERALPQDPALEPGRVFLAAEVIGRPSKDECWVTWPRPADVPLGTPAVCGDAFVGRVIEVRSSPRPLARVQLVTHATFRLGAEVRAGSESEGPIFLTAGGLRAPRSRSEPRFVRLAVHQPSSTRLTGGLARVHELFADADESAALADGFRLGLLRREGERSDLWIEPELDYLTGLHHLALVLAPSQTPAAAAPPSLLEDGRWLATRALTTQDASPWRSALKLPLGSADGLRAGAAVTSIGARLVGRVLHVGRGASDVGLIGDPGFHLTAVALPEGSDEPLVLGGLAAIGRAGPGAVRLRWWVRLPLALVGSAGSVPARLFTSPGDPGLPGGLFLGTTLLPRVAAVGEEHELVLHMGVEASDLGRLFVRLVQEGTP